MKKLLFAFAAGLLLLAGCAKEYDDTALKEKVDGLDKKVTELNDRLTKLESTVAAIKSFPDKIIDSYQEVKDEEGNVIGYTIKYVTGEVVTLTLPEPPVDNTPVIGVTYYPDTQTGSLWWYIYYPENDKTYLLAKVNIEDNVSVNEDGHLIVGDKDYGVVRVGYTLEMTEEGLVITFEGSEDPVVIPIADPFELIVPEAVVVTDEDKGKTIEVEYSLLGATANTVIDGFGDSIYDLTAVNTDNLVFSVDEYAWTLKGHAVVWANDENGRTSIKKITFGGTEIADVEIVDAPEKPEDAPVAYDETKVAAIADPEEGEVLVSVTSNVAAKIVSDCDWIHVDPTKGLIVESFVVDANPEMTWRFGNVNVVDFENDKIVFQTIQIAQKPAEKPVVAEGQWVLDKSNYKMNSYVQIPGEIGELSNYTFEVRFLSKRWKFNGGFGQRLLHITSDMDENDGFMLRWSDDKRPAGVLEICGGLGFGNNASMESTVFETNKWYTLSIAGDGENVNVFVNGEKVHTYAKSGKFIPKILALGQDWDDGSGYPEKQNFDGYIAYMRVWNVARSESDIKATLCSVANNAEGLVANWLPGKEKPGAIIPDQTGNGHDLDFSTAMKRPNGTPVALDVTEFTKQWVDYTDVICEGGGSQGDLQEGKAPYMKNLMFGVTFPDALNGGDEITFEGWIYPKSFSGAQANLPTFMGTENSILVRFENKKPDFLLGDVMTGGGEIHAKGTKELQTNKWYHIAATYKRNDVMKIYVNGVEQGSAATKDYPVNLNKGVTGDNDDAEIGRIFWVGNAFSTRWFDGNMSHVRIWNKALTVDEIKASANNKALEKAEGLIANWPLTEKEGLNIVDLSGNNLSTVFKTDVNKTVVEAESSVREDVNVPDLIFAESIELDVNSLEMTRGDQHTFVVTVTPANAIVPDIEWTSTDDNIASVKDGVLTAKGVGEATVTATAVVGETQLKAECSVSVAGLTGAVSPNLKDNWFKISGGLGSFDALTVEMRMRAQTWDATTVSSVFGREGKWLLRVGDEGIGINELQLATDHSNWTTGVTFENDKWYHLAVTYNTANTTAQVYVNGKLVAENTEFATKAADLTEGQWAQYYADRNVFIGASYLSGSSYSGFKNDRYFNGEMNEIRVWDCVRTADEIIANMNGFEGTSDNLKAYWKADLDDANNGDGKTLSDHSGNGKDAAAQGGDVRWVSGRPDVVPDAQPEPVYTDLSAKQANCFLIEEAGAYKFPAFKGNSNESVGAVASAEVIWETYNNAEEVEVGSVVAKAEAKDNWIFFETPAVKKAGNALIAAKDAEGKILWSWHIWIPATAVADIENGIHTTAMMDRNLGALDVAVASADAKINVNTMGMWYQWGRKDPFPGPRSIDVEGEYPGFAKVAGTSPVAEKRQLSIEESIAQPTLFARGLYVDDTLTNNDWNSTSDGTLWGDKGDGEKTTIADKTIYDPCPAGYRVPARDKSDDNKLWAAKETAAVGWAYNSTNYWFTLGDPAAVFPAAGYCDGGTAKTTFRTCLWNAHQDGDHPDTGYCIYIYLSSGAPKAANYAHGKARGYYVRCCK